MTKEEMPYKDLSPGDIEKKSFEILSNELYKMGFKESIDGAILQTSKSSRFIHKNEIPVIKRAIHTTADFDYLENLCFSELAVDNMMDAIENGACIVTDTQMAKSGINKKILESFGGEVFCFMSDEDVAKKAKETGQTRATISMEKAAELNRDVIFAIGNAPTALVKISELIKDGRIHPKGIIGVPVGFVNVVEAKELILESDCPYIVARGRKGGSNVAAAICNAILYQMKDDRN